MTCETGMPSVRRLRSEVPANTFHSSRIFSLFLSSPKDGPEKQPSVNTSRSAPLCSALLRSSPGLSFLLSKALWGVGGWGGGVEAEISCHFWVRGGRVLSDNWEYALSV